MSYNMKVKDVALFLNFKTDTIHSWVISGYIPHAYFGGSGRRSIRFDREELQVWIENKRSKEKEC